VIIPPLPVALTFDKSIFFYFANFLIAGDHLIYEFDYCCFVLDGSYFTG